LELKVLDSYKELSVYAAMAAAEYINENPGTLLCFAAGDTPLGMFEYLVSMQKEGLVDLNSVYYVGLDEWVGLGYEDKGSCVQVMRDCFYGPAGIAPERMRIFDGMSDLTLESEQVAAWIAGHGGIGFTMLGIGLNGHVGFNEPDSKIEGICGVVPLDQMSKSISIKYFGQVRSVEYGVTVSTDTLFSAARVLILASGENKADILKKVMKKENAAEIPAARFCSHPCVTFAVDKAAAC